MSLAGTTGVLDGIQAAAVPVRRRRLRLLPYALLAPSLLFLVLFTYLPVARVLVQSFYDKPHGTGQWIRTHHNETLTRVESFGVPIDAAPAAEIVFAG